MYSISGKSVKLMEVSETEMKLLSQLSVSSTLADVSEVKGKVKLFVFPFQCETMYQ